MKKESNKSKNALFILNIGLLIILLSALPQVEHNLPIIVSGLVIVGIGAWMIYRKKK